ncbi:ZrgA family zinc uptake protein [Fluviispira vulneris]|uniref:ZrgA family zinc uptake protein n=1 Tax=Fluviispira vulneris TaxID=2763012 RepID=UPI001648D1D9|nr:DUF2796 domain-containing protein [Fluviispira vulneris]
MLSKMHKAFIFISLALISEQAYAHGAHEHGTAKIDIALQDTDGSIFIKVPSESIYGFEHEAKSEADKKKVKEANNILRKNILEIVRFDPSLGCTATEDKITPFISDSEEENEHEHENSSEKKHGEHGDFQAEFKIKCKQTAIGSKIQFAFTTYFPKVQKIIVQLNSDKLQTSVTVSKNKGFIQL